MGMNTKRMMMTVTAIHPIADQTKKNSPPLAKIYQDQGSVADP
jgi:hypothetical protein